MEICLADRLKPFYEVLAQPAGYASAWKEKKKNSVIGYFCSYTPEEIIFAAGALPYRIFNTEGPMNQADAHLQAYSCSLVRGALNDGLSGNLDFLKGTVFPHTCDSIQRLSDIWRMNMGMDFHLDVVLPVVLHTENARNYMIAVLHKFKKDLETALGIEISKGNLLQAVQTYNNIRKLLKRLHELRRQNPALLSATALYDVTKASMIMDRMELVTAISELTANLDAQEAEGVAEGKRIVLAGGFCNMPGIFTTIEALDGLVVSDDFCTGTRYYQGMIDTDKDDVIEAIADRYLNRINCPAKHSGLFSRGDHIVDLAKESRADGVIFLYLKFCDPHAFDYPYIKELLKKEGIPSLLIEIEDQIPSEGQFRTRCEAFVEML